MEHALIFASIIVGVAVADQVMSLHRLLRARARVRWDWAAPAVALLVLLTVVQIWWAVAQPSAKPITIGRFLPLLVELILLVLLSAAVLPDEVPAEGIDLRRYYDLNGAYIWSLYAGAFGWLMVTGVVSRLAAGTPWAAVLGAEIPELMFLATMISLAVVRSRWWHLCGLALLGLGPINWLSHSLS